MTQRPRWLIVAHSAELYGADRTILQALPRLQEIADVTIACPSDGPLVERARTLGAGVVVVPDFALRRRYMSISGLARWVRQVGRATASLHRLHRQQPFAAVYVNTLAAAIGPVLKARWRIPQLVHVHECPRDPPWIARVLLKLTRWSADIVVCNSHYTRTFVVSHEPRLAGRTVVVHNGVDVPQVEPSPPAGPSFRITCVGRIHPKKGQHVLLEAAAEAATRDERWELHFFGDALPEHESLRRGLVSQAKSLGLNDRVHWHGFVEDTVAKYKGFDVAVVPSVVPEEFSLVCAEAQSMGLPVVVSGPGGASEVVVEGETGLIVPPGDPEALRRALTELARAPELRATMGQKGRARVMVAFTSDHYAGRIAELCSAVAHPSRIPA